MLSKDKAKERRQYFCYIMLDRLKNEINPKINTFSKRQDKFEENFDDFNKFSYSI
jgi:hypothetical protein